MNIAQIAAMQLQLHDGFTAFEYFEPGGGDDQVCWAAQSINGVTLIMLRGSTSFIDWIRDLDLYASPFEHDALGLVHPGMFIGAEQAWADIQAHTKPPWIVSGHSLGAARSAYISAFMVLNGTPPLGRVVFGEPKPGGSQLANIIAKVPQWYLRNGDAHHHDLVTDYPLLWPNEYVHPEPAMEVTARPDNADRLLFGPFDWHHMVLYSTASAKITDELVNQGVS